MTHTNLSGSTRDQCMHAVYTLCSCQLPCGVCHLQALPIFLDKLVVRAMWCKGVARSTWTEWRSG